MKKNIILFLLISQLSAQYIINDKSHSFNGLSITSVNINKYNCFVSSVGVKHGINTFGMSILKFRDVKPAFSLSLGFFPQRINKWNSLSLGILSSTTIQGTTSEDAEFPYINLLGGLQAIYRINFGKIELHPSLVYNRMFFQICTSMNYSATNNSFYQVYNWNTQENLFNKNSFHFGLAMLFKLRELRFVLNYGYKIEIAPNFQIGLSYIFKNKK